MAGAILRGLGLLMFFAGGLFSMSMLLVMLAHWSDPMAGLLDPWWGSVLIGLAALGAMVLGSLMGVFGMMMRGELRDVAGERFLLCASLSTLRDVLLVLGVLSALGGMIAASVFSRPVFLLALVPAVGGVVLAVGCGRLLKRTEERNPRPTSPS